MLLVGLLAVALFVCATTPNFAVLVLASLAVGMGAVIAQILMPFAAELAAPDERGRAVGVVFSGILTGILLARIVSGFISEAWGWRVLFVLAGVCALALGGVLNRALPKIEPKTTQSYGSLLASIAQLFMKYRTLQVACAIQACSFAIFSAFWSILALLLAGEPYHLGTAAAGAFGLVGLAGVMAANVSGQLVDRMGMLKIRCIGLLCCVAAWGVFLVNSSLVALVAGVLLLDFGLSFASVANQSMVLGLETEARNRINTIYVTASFLGGTIGTALATVAWAHGSWLAVCCFGLAVACLAVVIHLYGARVVGTAAVRSAI